MTRTRKAVNTAAYRRTHGTYPWNTQGQGKSIWAFTLDAAPQVVVKYGTYQQAKAWAIAQAQHTVALLP